MHQDMKTSSKLWVTTLIVLATLAGVSVAVLMWANAATGGEAVHPNASESFSEVEPADESDSDGTVNKIKTILASSPDTDSDLELLALGRVTSRTGSKFTIAQLGDQLCLSESNDGLGTCSNAEDAQTRGLYLALPNSCSSVRVAGLVPDGVELFVEQAGVQVLKVPVADNIYDISLPPKEAKLLSQNGDVLYRLPLDSFVSMAGGCG